MTSFIWSSRTGKIICIEKKHQNGTRLGERGSPRRLEERIKEISQGESSVLYLVMGFELHIYLPKSSKYALRCTFHFMLILLQKKKHIVHKYRILVNDVVKEKY